LSAPGGRRNRLSRKTRPAEHVYGVPVPKRLHEAIEIERDNLSKVESILACMAVSMEHETDPLTSPCYPDLAQIARELVDRSINGLDPFVLKQRLLGNKVEEGLSISCVDQPYPFLCHANSRQELIAPQLNG
jgi:hypothetical protein